MEKLLLGRGIMTKAEHGGRTKLCQFYALVKKGHEECGDSAFVYADETQAIIAVLDGVSGEAGAASASSLAAASVLESLKGKRPTEKDIREAFISASRKIMHGFTTISVVMVDEGGRFIMASVGDSPIYGITREGGIGLEHPLGRPVADGDALLKFLSFRNLVTSVLGPSSTDIEIRVSKGTIKKGEMVLIASDGLSDNLYLITKAGYVTDSSGVQDLKRLIGKLRSPERIVKMLDKEVESRISKGKVEEKCRVLVPKEDDVAIIALRWL